MALIELISAKLHVPGSEEPPSASGASPAAMLVESSSIPTQSWFEPLNEPDCSNLSALELWNLKPGEAAVNCSDSDDPDQSAAVADTASGNDDIVAQPVPVESHIELSDLRAQVSAQETMQTSARAASIVVDHASSAREPAVSPARVHGMASEREIFHPFSSLRIDTLVPASAQSAPIRQKLSSMPSAKAIFLQHRSRPPAAAIEPRHDSSAVAPRALIMEMPLALPEPEPVLTSAASLSILALSSRSVFAASANRAAKLPPPPMPTRQATGASHVQGPDRPLLVSSASHADRMRPFISAPCHAAHRGNAMPPSACGPVMNGSVASTPSRFSAHDGTGDSARKGPGPRMPYRILSTMESSERQKFANRNRR
jgi:hypothetical protein